MTLVRQYKDGPVADTFASRWADGLVWPVRYMELEFARWQRLDSPREGIWLLVGTTVSTDRLFRRPTCKDMPQSQVASLSLRLAKRDRRSNRPPESAETERQIFTRVFLRACSWTSQWEAKRWLPPRCAGETDDFANL